MHVKLLFAKDFEISIKTPHNDPDRAVRPEYEGHAAAIGFLKALLRKCYGFYGHSFDPDETTNLDLGQAVRQPSDLGEGIKLWELISIEPEIKPNKLPDGAIP